MDECIHCIFHKSLLRQLFWVVAVGEAQVLSISLAMFYSRVPVINFIIYACDFSTVKKICSVIGLLLT